MATWEDGPEYAPLERPAEFSTPATEPLDTGPPPAEVAPRLPVDRPAFTGPSVPVAPLETLIPVPADVRDPVLPFEVVSSNLTSGSAWGSAHQASAAPTAPAVLPAPTAPAWPAPVPATPWPPTPQPWPATAPSAQAWPPVQQPPWPGTATPPNAPAGFPSPGTPQWFGPGPYGEQPPTERVGPRAVLEAATPGLLAVLAVGAVIFVLSPVLLVVAYALSSRVTVARDAVRRALGISLAAVGFFGLVGLTRDLLGFSEWWSFVGIWSLLLCWGMLVTVSGLDYRGLRNAAGAPPAPRGDWR